MKPHLNLLPWQLRCRLLFRQRLRQWFLGWAALTAIALVLLGMKWQTLAADHQVWHESERRVSTTRAVDEGNLRLKRKLSGLTQQINKHSRRQSEQIGYQILATISQGSASCEGRIQVQKLTFKQQAVTVAPTPGATPGPTGANVPVSEVKKEVRTVLLSGVAANNLAIAQFITALRDSRAFQTIDLKSSRGKLDDESGAQMYHLECSF